MELRRCALPKYRDTLYDSTRLPFQFFRGILSIQGGGYFSDSFAMSPRSGSDSAPTEIDDGKAISSIDYDGMIVREGEHA